MGKRNPIAKAVRTPVYRPRIVKSRKTYSRKSISKRAGLTPAPREAFRFWSMTMTVRYDPPPIPDRRFDWVAYENEECGPYGYGRTAYEAVADYLFQVDE